MFSLFNKSKAGEYKEKPGGIAGLLRADNFAIRVVIFLIMSVVFFGILKISERKIPHGLVPDSTEADTGKPAVHRSK